jgi:hypothetical protein
LIFFYKNISAPPGPPPGDVEKNESKKKYESENKKKELKKKVRDPAIDSTCFTNGSINKIRLGRSEKGGNRFNWPYLL